MQKNKSELFHQFVSSPDYSSLQQIIKSIPHLNSLQYNKFTNINSFNGLIIRSSNDDNIHKAIKYAIWTTTFKNKFKLEELWKQYQERNIQTLLFFSTIKSGHFEGVARLASSYNQQTFPFWWENQNGKFKGYFQIQWLYIKDISYKHFNGLKNSQGQDVTRSKDCDDLTQEVTKQMLKIFQNSKSKNNIFNSFKIFDDRENQYLRNILTPEQQMWLINQQLKQMQLQQQYLYQMSGLVNFNASNNMLNTNTNNNLGITAQNTYMNPSEGTKVGTTNNPGFQMNPISKNKKYKEK